MTPLDLPTLKAKYKRFAEQYNRDPRANQTILRDIRVIRATIECLAARNARLISSR